MTDLRNELTWSFSRHERLLACPRRYFYKHYGSWGGWERDAPDFTRELYRLGKLERRATWSGAILHKVIARALDAARAGAGGPRPAGPAHAPDSPAAVDALVEEALGWMRQDFADSRDDVARRTRNLKQHVRFLEHEMPHDPASPRWRQQWKDAAAQVERGIRWFFASESWATLSRLPASRWIEIEDWTGRSPPPTFELRAADVSVAVFARVDCAYREDSGRVVVIDWKTGKADSSASSHQLATYALYMRERHGVAPEDLVAREVNVVHGTQREHDVSPRALEAFEGLVAASLGRMRSLLVDEDARANVPKPEAEFAFAADEAECRWCVYRSACPRTAGAL